MFNRFSWIAQLKLIDWLSGDVADQVPPQPYLSQKNKDWLAFLITKFPTQVVNGLIDKPEDYYQFENFYVLGNKVNGDCEEDENKSDGCNQPIELLDGSKFYTRCNTDIEELKPSFEEPICKEIGKNFEVLPTDLGSVTLEYIRYPKRAILNTKEDTVFNDLVYDAATSEDFEWPEFAREILVWFICDSFSNRTREQALKTFNTMTGKTTRDGK